MQAKAKHPIRQPPPPPIKSTLTNLTAVTLTHEAGETLAVGVVGAAGLGGREYEVRVVVLERHRAAEIAAAPGTEVEDLVLHAAER